MPGRHNAMNALAVIAVLSRIGCSAAAIAEHLPRFPGVRRRQEVRGTVRGITVIDDFAHHPTAVRETLAALKAAYPGQRLVAVFEPRTNSSRRKVFQADYVQVFDHADQVLIKEPQPLATLAEELRFSGAQLGRDLLARGCQARCFADTDAIIATLAQDCQQGDVIAIMSNGGFDNIHTRLLAALVQES
jgi:UDP-N-acetylmuramate: L-alanyl-gamma-D-glutamyl-meso-diaminopimelate ligase